MPDLEMPCVQCKDVFLFTEKEQQIFYQRNMPPPQRCLRCRSKKAVSGENAPTRFEMVCDNCGRHDHVPFQPKVGRSVLCKDCFQASKSRLRVA
ncbi:MAG: zinc-ribbon domain containing protein [Pyrinomonadaceae bacterium]|nr:zinc-ribbon domain containing protein [Pyrinomonadaceae bacterium]